MTLGAYNQVFFFLIFGSPVSQVGMGFEVTWKMLTLDAHDVIM